MTPVTPITRLFYRSLALVGAGVFLSGSGCIALESPEDFGMCDRASDCDLGEQCDEGICWGNPPDSTFAAILLPPVDGPLELAPTVIPELRIGNDGSIDDLAFAEPALITGRVVLDCGETPTLECDPRTSIAARITFTQASAIPGQPPYTRTVFSEAGLDIEQPSFAIALPRSDQPYHVEVLPNAVAGDVASEVAVALAPPTSLELTPSQDIQVEWHLGSPDTHREFYGRVIDSLELPLPDMQVFAVAAGAPMSADERISSITATDESGFFTLAMVAGEEKPFDLIAISSTDNSVPALRVRGRDPIDPFAQDPVDVGSLVMPPYGLPQQYTVPVRGIDNNGDKAAIAGATVRVTTILSAAEDDTIATFSSVAYTDELGDASLQLIPGNNSNRVYIADIEPLDDSHHATLHGYTLDVGASQGGFLEEVSLEARVAVGGEIRTADGMPAAGTTVEARLAAGFRSELEAHERALVERLHLPSTVTDQSGLFVIWLDQSLAERDAVYSLRLTPADPLAALSSVPEVDAGEENEFGTVELPVIELPTASYARGVITTDDGTPVPGAELRLFELVTDEAACEGGPQPCVSLFRGLSDADDDGEVMVILPE